ncbi:unnamed protein product [Cylicostephanus goldi]|uniref:Peptidase M13 N-terminal domain-containing protein n=1 Tax=Cylicostephanus goldi TaxID=71465 RepID=A0A3P6T5X2_CYLGO|nr:unnamed protein product [Cylicostephanus goldi]
MWFSRKWLGEMGEIYEDIEQEYNNEMFGQKQKRPRWKMCTEVTTTVMNDATIALYVKKALDKTTKKNIINIANDLLEVFRKKLNTSNWIDEETRIEALNKLNHMLRQIAYPEFVLNTGMLDKHYRDLDVRDTDSYSEMVEKLTRWHIERFFEQLTKLPDRFVIFNPADVRASYYLHTNSLRKSMHLSFFAPTYSKAAFS